jgi:hypothetical protein
MKLSLSRFVRVWAFVPPPLGSGAHEGAVTEWSQGTSGSSSSQVDASAANVLNVCVRKAGVWVGWDGCVGVGGWGGEGGWVHWWVGGCGGQQVYATRVIDLTVTFLRRRAERVVFFIASITALQHAIAIPL